MFTYQIEMNILEYLEMRFYISNISKNIENVRKYLKDLKICIGISWYEDDKF